MTALPDDQAAIDAALAQQWTQAIALNTAILKNDKANINALNRLGFSYLMTGQLPRAKLTFHKVIKVDPYNQIALKNLKKLGTLRQKDMIQSAPQNLSPMLFLEEPGLTKLVECINLAPLPILATLTSGQEVLLKAKNHSVEIRGHANTYLGVLPDDLSFKLIKLMAAGNRYQAIIKSVGKNALMVMLRELARGKRFAHQPSFISQTSYVPFAKTATGAEDSPDVTPTGEDDEGPEPRDME